MTTADEPGSEPRPELDDRPRTGSESGPRSDRRAFLAGAGAAALVGLGAACTDSGSDEAAGDSTADDAQASAAAIRSEPVAFRAERQLGVLRAPTAAGLVAAFDVGVASRAELSETLMRLSAEVERIMSATPAATADEILPPPDSGIVGGGALPGNTSITLGVGASLFDQRFGLTERAPNELILMPQFFNDRLVRPELSNGDLALIIASDDHNGAIHALHQAVRVTTGKLRLRWVQEGYNDLLPPADGQIAPTRNLLGFRDGTSNLDTTDTETMDRHVWVQPDDGEPDWATGGTYVAVRVIRMLIEFWSTTALVRQEQIFGRHRDSGAPIGQSQEGEEPAFASDQSDETVPIRSHMRLANPRTPDTGRILRRGFSYLNGSDGSGALDQGLLFLAYQRALTTGFFNVQSRLEGEPLEDYIKPVGGGLFFVPPGPGDDGWLGQSLLG